MSKLARALQAVRPHVPSIRFPQRAGDAAGAAASTQPALAVSTPTVATPSASPPSNSNPLPPITSRYIESNTMPDRYRRKSISAEEMAFIERGGPE